MNERIKELAADYENYDLEFKFNANTNARFVTMTPKAGKDGDVRIFCIGTDFSNLKDIAANAKMAFLGLSPAQFDDAMDVYDEVYQTNKDRHIKVIGHSEGASEAQAITYNAVKNGNNKIENINFAPYSIEDVKGYEDVANVLENNSKSYKREGDVVSAFGDVGEINNLSVKSWKDKLNPKKAHTTEETWVLGDAQPKSEYDAQMNPVEKGVKRVLSAGIDAAFMPLRIGASAVDDVVNKVGGVLKKEDRAVFDTESVSMSVLTQALSGDGEVPVLNWQGGVGGAKEVESVDGDNRIVPAVMNNHVAPEANGEDVVDSVFAPNEGMVEHHVAPQKFDESTGEIAPESASYKIEESPKVLEPINSKGLDNLDAYLYLEDRLSRGLSKIEQLQQIMSNIGAYPAEYQSIFQNAINGYLEDMRFTLPEEEENFLQDLRFQGMEMDLKESGLSHYFPVIETENDELNQLLAKERRGNIERTFGKVFDVYNGTSSAQRQYFDNSYTKNLFLSPQHEFAPNVKNLLNDIEKQGVDEYLTNSLPSLIEQKKNAMKSFFQNGTNKLISWL